MDWQEVMKDVISEILEKMFFNVVEFEGEEEGREEGEISTHISLKSQKDSITVVISLNQSFARQLTADFLGKIVGAITDADTEDCMKELANMIGGGIVARIGGYKLELPQLGEPPLGSSKEESIVPIFVLGTPVGKIRMYKEVSP